MKNTTTAKNMATPTKIPVAIYPNISVTTNADTTPKIKPIKIANIKIVYL